MTSKIEIAGLFEAIDSKNADAFTAYLTEDAVFRYGSQDPVQGREAIRAYVAGFFGTIEALSHRVDEVWEGDGSLACMGEVTYTREGGSRVTLPFANVFRLEGEKVREYQIHVDPSPLFA